MSNPYYDGQPGLWRGGCHDCGWFGPDRDFEGDADDDARDHDCPRTDLDADEQAGEQ